MHVVPQHKRNGAGCMQIQFPESCQIKMERTVPTQIRNEASKSENDGANTYTSGHKHILISLSLSLSCIFLNSSFDVTPCGDPVLLKPLLLILAVHHPADCWHRADWEHTADGVLLSVWWATSRTLNSPPPPSSSLQSLLRLSYTSSDTYTHTPSSVTWALPGHLLPSLQRPARTHRKCNISWHIQRGHIYGTITCTDSLLFSRHAPPHSKMTRNFIDTLTSLPTLRTHPGLVSYEKRLMKYSFSSLVSKSIRLQPSSNS